MTWSRGGIDRDPAFEQGQKNGSDSAIQYAAIRKEVDQEISRTMGTQQDLAQVQILWTLCHCKDSWPPPPKIRHRSFEEGVVAEGEEVG